jgi:ketosteroid isomerase-like protein
VGTDQISAVERLAIEHECAKVVHRSLNALDEGDIAAFLALFSDDAVVERPSKPGQPLIGKDAIVAEYSARPRDRISFHLCTNIVVTVMSAESAEAFCHVMLYTGRPSESSELPKAEPRHMAGTFRDTLIKKHGQWLFARREGRMILKVETAAVC